MADDSGLCVDALNGAPGVYSARYAGEHGNDAANNEKLMAEMQNVPVGQRAAKFVSAVCLILPDGRELVVTGECPGSVALTPAGDNGFGYDPLFVPRCRRPARRRHGTQHCAPHLCRAGRCRKKTPSATAAAPWKSWKPSSPHFWANEPQRKN